MTKAKTFAAKRRYAIENGLMEPDRCTGYSTARMLAFISYAMINPGTSYLLEDDNRSGIKVTQFQNKHFASRIQGVIEKLGLEGLEISNRKVHGSWTITYNL